jgi:hypothetical protein
MNYHDFLKDVCWKQVNPKPNRWILGFNTGILWVRFSHTVPEPAHPVSHHGYTHTQTVNHAVSNETRGILLTCGIITDKITYKIHYLLLHILL